MTPDRAALLDRIQNFDIDGVESSSSPVPRGTLPTPRSGSGKIPAGPAVALPFAARLARENGWSRPYAERVIVEYRRFVFLTMTAGFTVCPSEDVDAAWHLHLTYTRSYWKRFCGDVLGQPLHHEPTKGGPAEARKHLAMYAQTLAAYREAFGEEPPADIWPAAEVRFGEDLRHRVVNTARNWVIPKAPVKRVLQVTVAGLILALFVPGCAGGGLNPFNLVGTDFLYFLIPVMLAAVCIGRVIRTSMRSPDPEPGDEELEFTWEQAAYLAGGYPRLTTAAIARLYESGVAEVSASGSRIVRSHTSPGSDLTPVETAVLNALPVGNTAAELKPVQEAVEAKFSVEAAKLEANQFTLPIARQVGIGFAAAVPLLLVILLFGVPRLVMAISKGKPTDYLGAALAIGGLLGVMMVLVGSLRLSRRGEAVLATLRARYADLRSNAGRSEDGNAGLAVALFGTAALAGLGLMALATWFPRQTTDGSSGGCGSGCGSGCGGGGGGGCGGCGGD
jgi:uncharacterized protein (TIGR04222 family)